jgi:hypothetical protein
VGCTISPRVGTVQPQRRHEVRREAANIEAVDAIKARPARVCPLVCEQGFKADGERCARITCRTGYEVGDHNNCEKVAVKKVRRERLEMAKTAPKPAARSTETPQARFANSPTCTNVRLACEQGRSKYGLGAGHCASSFAQCIQTGKWSSSYSNYEGLAQR